MVGQTKTRDDLETGVILPFPRLPRHKPYAEIIRQNHAQANEHYADVFAQTDAATEYGRRWRDQAFHRQHAASMARLMVRLATLDEAV